MLIRNLARDPTHKIERVARTRRSTSFRLANGRTIKRRNCRNTFVHDDDLMASHEQIVQGIREGRIALTMDDGLTPVSIEAFERMVHSGGVTAQDLHEDEPTEQPAPMAPVAEPPAPAVVEPVLEIPTSVMAVPTPPVEEPELAPATTTTTPEPASSDEPTEQKSRRGRKKAR